MVYEFLNGVGRYLLLFLSRYKSFGVASLRAVITELSVISAFDDHYIVAVIDLFATEVLREP